MVSTTALRAPRYVRGTKRRVGSESCVGSQKRKIECQSDKIKGFDGVGDGAIAIEHYGNELANLAVFSLFLSVSVSAGCLLYDEHQR